MNDTRTTLPIAAVLLTCTLAVAQWEQRAPTTSPSARRGAAMTYAPTVGGLLLFGGTGNPAPSGETWLYDGDDWSLLAPANAPAARQEAEMVFDLARGVAVMYGGINPMMAGSVGETWEFNGATWTQVPTSATPCAIYRQGMCYDLNGAATLTWNPVVAVVGDRLYAQGLCLDPGVNPAWLTASNGVVTTLGF